VPLPVTVPAAAPTRLDPSERAAIEAAIARVVRDGPWIGGPAVAQFESDFAAYLGAREVLGVANGTDALALAFAALELAPGSGILIAANEGGYAATAARQVGLEPMVMDIDPDTLMPSVATACTADDPRVAAVVVTHLHGDAVDLAGLDAWRRGRGLRLIEDCAQAAGLRVDGRHLGLTGDAATFRFYPTKNLGALGDGGAVVVADSEAAARARSLAEYGWRERFRIELPGGRNSRLDPLQAAILSARLPFLDRRNEARREISRRYRATLGPVARMYGDPATTVAHHAVVIEDQIEGLADLLAGHGVQTARHYPFLNTEMPGLGIRNSTATPNANKLRDQSLSLPCFPELEPHEIELVISVLEGWVDAHE
jgi:aminotransferase EvaB